MKRIILGAFMSLALPCTTLAQPSCDQDKILSTTSVTGKLKDYYIEEVQEVPSTITFIVKGKELDLVADPDYIQKYLKNKQGRSFQVTYERVYGWIGDGCDKYERLKGATPQK